MVNLVDFRKWVLYPKVVKPNPCRIDFVNKVIEGMGNQKIIKGKENYEKTEKRFYAC